MQVRVFTAQSESPRAYWLQGTRVAGRHWERGCVCLLWTDNQTLGLNLFGKIIILYLSNGSSKNVYKKFKIVHRKLAN